MKKDILHNAIDRPELLDEQSMADLLAVTSQFPYFGAAQMLLTKAFQNVNDHRYTDQLHQSAIYTPDRKLLYNLVKNKENSVQKEKEHVIEIATAPVAIEIKEPEDVVNETSSEVSKLADWVIEEETPSIKSEALIQPKEEVQQLIEEPPFKPEFISVTSAEIKEAEPKTAAVTEESDEEKEEIIHEEIKLKDLDPLQQGFLLEAMQSSIEMEVQPEKMSTEEKDNTPVMDVSDDDQSYAAMIYRRSMRMKFASDSSEEPQSNEVPKGVGDWLRNQEPTDVQEEKSEIQEDLPAFQSTPLSHGKQRIVVDDTKTHQRQLIDRFIQLEPNIPRGKASEYVPGNIAKESTEEDYSFVTETMAQLFARQGKPDKARKAYKKLIELYPEKSIYFAAQLKNLDKLKK